MMVIWSDDLDAIIPTCKDFEDKLIKLLWRSRPAAPPSARSYAGSLASGSVVGHGSDVGGSTDRDGLMENGSVAGMRARTRDSRVGTGSRPGTALNVNSTVAGSGNDLEKGTLAADDDDIDEMDEKALIEEEKALNGGGGGWLCFGRKKKDNSPVAKRRRQKIRDRRLVNKRGVKFYAPLYNGAAAALALCEYLGIFDVFLLNLTKWVMGIDFMCTGINTLLREWKLDNDFIRFALVVLVPFLFSVSLVSIY